MKPHWIALAVLAALAVQPMIAAERLRAPELIAFLKKQPGPVELRETFVASFKPEALKNGSGVMYDGPEVIFAFENEMTPALRVDDMPGPALKRIPDSNLWYV